MNSTVPLVCLCWNGTIWQYQLRMKGEKLQIVSHTIWRDISERNTKLKSFGSTHTLRLSEMRSLDSIQLYRDCACAMNTHAVMLFKLQPFHGMSKAYLKDTVEFAILTYLRSASFSHVLYIEVECQLP